MQKKKRFLSFFVRFTLILLVIVFLRLFFIASFKIPSSSMEPTLLSGDFVLVSKLIPGPRVDFRISNILGEKISFYRIPGLRSIKKNDIIVFNKPSNSINDFDKYYVKRCIAISGDSVYLDLNRYNTIDSSISIKSSIYIPRKGETIPLDTGNILFYKNLIENETQKRVRLQGKTFFLDDVLIYKYKFTQNYYYVIGDNSLHSIDSRDWGLLPEDHIIGKVICIWKSKYPNTNEYRFRRFFKLVR